METDDKIENAEAKGPAKKLGLSKVVYALGMSARDSLLTFAAATATLLPIIYYGQKKNDGFINKLAAVPEQVQNFVSEKMGGDRAGRFGKALAVSAGLATLIGYAAHVPGLVRGPKKIKQAEDIYNAQVDENNKLNLEIKSLGETIKRQGVELTEAKMQNPEFASRMETPQTPAPETPSQPKFTEKLATQRATNESSYVQSA